MVFCPVAKLLAENNPEKLNPKIQLPFPKFEYTIPSNPAAKFDGF